MQMPHLIVPNVSALAMPANPFLKSLEMVLSHAQQPQYKQLNYSWSNSSKIPKIGRFAKIITFIAI